MKINEISTCELVQELETREGVETIKQGPEGKDTIMATDEGKDYYEMHRTGPCIIFRVID